MLNAIISKYTAYNSMLVIQWLYLIRYQKLCSCKSTPEIPTVFVQGPLKTDCRSGVYPSLPR